MPDEARDAHKVDAEQGHGPTGAGGKIEPQASKQAEPTAPAGRNQLAVALLADEEALQQLVRRLALLLEPQLKAAVADEVTKADGRRKELTDQRVSEILEAHRKETAAQDSAADKSAGAAVEARVARMLEAQKQEVAKTLEASTAGSLAKRMEYLEKAHSKGGVTEQRVQELLETSKQEINAKLEELVKADLDRDPLVKDLRALHKEGIVTEARLQKALEGHKAAAPAPAASHDRGLPGPGSLFHSVEGAFEGWKSQLMQLVEDHKATENRLKAAEEHQQGLKQSLDEHKVAGAQLQKAVEEHKAHCHELFATSSAVKGVQEAHAQLQDALAQHGATLAASETQLQKAVEEHKAHCHQHFATHAAVQSVQETQAQLHDALAQHATSLAASEAQMQKAVEEHKAHCHEHFATHAVVQSVQETQAQLQGALAQHATSLAASEAQMQKAVEEHKAHCHQHFATNAAVQSVQETQAQLQGALAQHATSLAASETQLQKAVEEHKAHCHQHFATNAAVQSVQESQAQLHSTLAQHAASLAESEGSMRKLLEEHKAHCHEHFATTASVQGMLEDVAKAGEAQLKEVAEHHKAAEAQLRQVMEEHKAAESQLRQALAEHKATGATGGEASERGHAELHGKVAELWARCESSFASSTSMHEMEESLKKAVAAEHDAFQQGLADLRAHCAAEIAGLEAACHVAYAGIATTAGLEEHIKAIDARLEAVEHGLASPPEGHAAPETAHPPDALTETKLQELLDKRLSGYMTADQARELMAASFARPPSTPASGTARPVSIGGSPVPFAAASARPKPQQKAAWPSASFTTLSGGASPATDLLTHRGLEQTVVERAIGAVPDYRRLGFDEVVIRDMVNAVVRDIVGIFESLIDRLLVEKKQDTIRAMVAELMTEDLAATIATGTEQLKKQEFAHIADEISRLRAEVRESETAWESKFRVTHELRDSQDDLWNAVDGRYKAVEARLEVVEKEFVHSSALSEHAREIHQRVLDTSSVTSTCEADIQALQRRAEAIEAHCKQTFATAVDVDAAVERLAKAIAVGDEAASAGLAELRGQCAFESRVAELQASHDELLKKVAGEIAEAKQDVSELALQLKQEQRSSAETFATKAETVSAVAKMAIEREHGDRDLADRLGRLEAAAATKRALDEEAKAITKELGRTQKQLADTTDRFDRMVVVVRQLEDRCDNTLATREYAAEVASAEASRMAKDCDEKEEIQQLRREFEEERERLRQNTRQQQNTRKDLNEVQEILHDVKMRSGELMKQSALMADQVRKLDGREAAHFQECQASSLELRHAQADLEALFHTHRIEEQYKGDGDKLPPNSTQRYLDQIDKAFAVHPAVHKLDMAREPKDTQLRLPRVA